MTVRTGLDWLAVWPYSRLMPPASKLRDEGDMRKITVRLPPRLVKQAQHYAIDADQDLQDVISEALEQFLARKGAR
jgi:hypothetical protein